MLGASSISVVFGAYRPERTALVRLLEGLSPSDWAHPTEMPGPYPKSDREVENSDPCSTLVSLPNQGLTRATKSPVARRSYY